MADDAANDNGLKAASDRIRETAKWLTVTLGAVGALLLAGTQLSNIGEIEVGSQRFFIAMLGGAVAAAGTIAVLIASVLVATTPVMSLTRLTSTPIPDGAENALDDQYLRMGYADVSSLAEDYARALQDRKAAIEQHGAVAPESRAAHAKAATIDGIVTRLVLVSSHMNLARRWRNAMWPICIGAIVAGVGVVLFVWAANPPDDAKASTNSPGMLKNAKAAVLVLNETGQNALREATGCDVDGRLQVLTLDATSGGADVVIIEPGCKTVRAVITDTWGSVKEN